MANHVGGKPVPGVSVCKCQRLVVVSLFFCWFFSAVCHYLFAWLAGREDAGQLFVWVQLLILSRPSDGWVMRSNLGTVKHELVFFLTCETNISKRQARD